MADINKSVSVKFDADVSKLLSDVKGLSGLSEKEAKAVGDALSKNMKAAGKSAEVAAKKTQASMKKMENSSKGADRAFRQLKRRSSEIGRGFGELSMIIGETDTPMGNFVNSISGIALTGGALIPLFGALRGAIVGLGASAAVATGGLTIVAGALALLVTNMGGVDEEAEKQQRQIDRLGKVYRKLNDKIQKSITANEQFRSSLENTIFRIDALDREFKEKQIRLDFKLGKISRQDFEDFMMETKISAASTRIEKSFDDRSRALKKSISNEQATLNDLRHSLSLAENEQVKLNKAGANFGMADIDAGKINVFVKASTTQSEIEEFINKTFTTRNKVFRDGLRAYATQLQLTRSAREAESKFNKERKTEQARIIGMARDTIEGELAVEKARARQANSTKNNQENEKDNEKRLKEIEQQRLSIASQLEKIDNDKLNADQQKLAAVEKQLEKAYELIGQNKQLAKDDSELVDGDRLINELLQKREKIQKDIARATEEQKITEKTEDEIALYRELFDMQKLGYDELQDLRFKYEDSFLEHEQKIHKEVLRMIAERNEATKQGIQDTIGLMGSFGGATIEALDNVGVKNQELVNNLFMLQRAASVAQIAFSTAENITKAQGYPAPLNAIATGLAIATGVAQTAAVMSQPAPQVKKHMGGMIGPDERNYTLLRGEAVLDRQTVRNIGGAEGVRKLQQKQTAPEVVIMQPFKHFDRFIKARSRKIGKPIKQGY